MVYLDNSATTPVSAAVISRMEDVMRHTWGNPSSAHGLGLRASDLMNISRRQILASLGVRNPAPGDHPRLIFTGSGTEANNLALFGTAYTRRDARFTPRMVISADQHPSVLEAAKRLEKNGVEIVYLPTKGGDISPADVANAVDKNTILISVMLVNNETGAVYDVKKLFGIARAKNPNIVCHCDAVQGFMHVRGFSPDACGCGMTTISAHKLGGPKGIGALYLSKDVYTSRKLSPYILGGGQEGTMRSGTENLPAIAGFAEALKEGVDIDKLETLRARLISGLPDEITVKQTKIPAPHIVNITLPGIKSETMVHYLSSKEIYVSAGSACSTHARNISNALLCWGASERDADCSIRISLSDKVTESGIDEALAALKEGLSTLARTE